MYLATYLLKDLYPRVFYKIDVVKEISSIRIKSFTNVNYYHNIKFLLPC